MRAQKQLLVGVIVSVALALTFSITSVGAVQDTPPAGDPAGAGQAPAGRGAGRGGFGGGAQVAYDWNDHEGFTQIFDGRTLAGWEGATDIWSVANGAIVGLSCPDKPAGTTFIRYEGAQPGDFELKVEMMLQNGNSGIQYRSRNVVPEAGGFGRGGGGGRGPQANRGAGPGGPGGPGAAGRGGPGGPGGGRGRGGAPAEPLADCADRQAPADAEAPAGGGFGGGAYSAWNLQGYQFDYAGNGTGNLWEGGRFPGERGTITNAGQVMLAKPEDGRVLLATLGTPDEIASIINTGDWNQVHIIARGYTFLHIINGRLVSATVDDNPEKRVASGVIGFQVEGTNMKVQFRNIWLKVLD